MNSTSHSRRRRAGTSLLEILLYASLLVVLMNLSAQVLLTCVRMSALGDSVDVRAQQSDALERAYVGAVRNATGVVAQIDRHRSDGTTLVLASSSYDGVSGRFYTVFEPAGEEKRLVRRVFSEHDGTFELVGQQTFAAPLADLQFVYDAPDPAASRLVTLVATPKSPRGGAGNLTPIRFAASPRGVLAHEGAQP